jgi:hypothetical protein
LAFLASATRARNSTAGVFDIQFHSALRRNEKLRIRCIDFPVKRWVIMDQRA